METRFAATAAFCLGAGVVIWQANRHRFTNQVFSIISLLVAGWLWCVHEAVAAGTYFTATTHPAVFWLRLNGAILAFFPWGLFLLNESVVSKGVSRSRIVWRSLALLIPCVVCACTCFTDSYLHWPANASTAVRGPAYYSL